MNSLISKILANAYHDPFQYLGVHEHPLDDKIKFFRTLQPKAEKVSLLIDGKSYEMDNIDEIGVFECFLSTDNLKYPLLDPFDYRYRIVYSADTVHEINDPYRFLPLLSDNDLYLFNAGTNYSLYNLLGAQLEMHQKLNGTVFRVWAPSAVNVSVIGHFNGWDKRVHQMRSLDSSGIWELFVPGLEENEIYRFVIRTKDGTFHD